MNLAALSDENLVKYGEYERLVFEGRRYTNHELHAWGTRLASGLRTLGLEPGDRVVLVMMNCPEVLVTYHAIWRAGFTVVPVLFLLDVHEIAYILKNSRARAVITSADFAPRIADAVRAAGTDPVLVVSGDAKGLPPDARSFEELSAAEPLGTPVAREPGDLAVVLYTSGTTGNPKGVMQTHHNLLANARNSYESQTRKDLQLTSLLVLPLAHSFGLAVSISGNLHGGLGVLMRWFEPEGALRLIQEHRVQFMAGVPTMFVYMMNHPKAEEFDTKSVERWLVGGAPMPVEQMLRFEKKFGGRMYVGYGLTESCPGLVGEREGMPRKEGSAGIPLEGVELKIVDDAGRSLPRGEKGEIVARGENISPGYFENAEATAETFRDGWLFTGDVGYMDDDGYVFIVERKKDLIIRGGFNIYPKDVEEVLHQHAAVRECAVVGVPDELMGEEVCAYVALAYGTKATPEDLMAHCKERMAKYKTPRWVEIVSDLPKTNIGKIKKKDVRLLAAARFGRPATS